MLALPCQNCACTFWFELRPSCHISALSWKGLCIQPTLLQRCVEALSLSSSFEKLYSEITSLSPAVENGYGHDKRSPSASPATSVNPRLADPNDSITQAMMNAAKAQRNPSKAEASPKPSPQPNNESQQSKPVRKPVLAAFGDDEEEDKPRQLKVINYSEEEQKAGQQVSARDAKDKPSSKEKANAIKALIAKVPTETKAVFSYNISWDAFDKGGEALSTKVRGWVATKTNQLLGVEEPSMIDFIMTQLQNHVSASKLLEEVEGVLDDEANPFVFKLYRMVIFESLKQEADLQD